MYYVRNAVLSVPIAVALVVIFYFASATPTTMQVQNVQKSLPATARGFPLPYEYQFNCPYTIQATYCSISTLPVHTPTLTNPTKMNYTNAVIDYVFWFAIVFFCVSVLDAVTSKRFAKPAEEEKILSPA
jgi:hypothetical protein